MYIKTSALIPTHNRLRNPELVEKFLGNLSLLDSSIENQDDKISVGEVDGMLYVFNSHHRIVAVDIAYGRIDESLLNIKSYTLEQMLSVNLDIGWVTPFDPHFYCRVPDFKNEKQKILDRARVFSNIDKRSEDIKKEALVLIEPRKIQTFGELYRV